jgi:hypothetical protein
LGKIADRIGCIESHISKSVHTVKNYNKKSHLINERLDSIEKLFSEYENKNKNKNKNKKKKHHKFREHQTDVFKRLRKGKK